jgi:hypothetical protein
MADPTSPDPSKVALVTGASEASVSRHLSPVNVQRQGARAFTVRARLLSPVAEADVRGVTLLYSSVSRQTTNTSMEGIA